MTSDPLTIAEAAKICGVDEATVQGWVNSKLFRFYVNSKTGDVHLCRASFASFLRKKKFPWHVIDRVLRRKFFTTGEVARICGVTARTVSEWIDEGRLKGFRILGRYDRRVHREDLARFLKEEGIPLGELERELHRNVLFVGGRRIFEEARRIAETLGNYVYEFEINVLGAAFRIAEKKCRVVVVDLEIGRDWAADLVSAARRYTGSSLWIVALAEEDETDLESLCKLGFNDALKKPINIGELVTRVHVIFERL